MKLPDLRVNRPVRELKSSKVAQLPNQMRNISAGVQAAGTVASALDRVVESEATLDATRRMNNAQREYTKQAAALTQDYHTDRDKPLSDYGPALDSLRETILDEATAGADYYSRSKVSAASDNYRTQLKAHEVAAVTKLTESRMVMNLTVIARDNLRGVSETGDVDFALNSYTDAVNATTLDATVKQDEIAKYNTAVATSAVAFWTNEGDLENLTGFVDTEPFKQLSPEQQANVNASIVKSTGQILSEDFNKAQHQLAIGNWSPERGWEFVDSSIDSIQNIPPAVRDEMKEKARLDMGSTYIGGLLAAGQDQQVIDILTGSKYIGKYDSDKIPGWLNSARSGLTAGRDASATMANYVIDNEITKAKNGTGPNPAAVAGVVSQMGQFSESAGMGLQIKLRELGEYSAYQTTIDAAPTASSDNIAQVDAQLAGKEQTILDDPSSEDYSARLGAVRAARKNLQSQITAREKDPVLYAINNDPMSNKTWTDFQTAYGMIGADGGPTMDEVSSLYSAYKGNVLRAQNLYSIPESEQVTVPQSPNLLKVISDTLVKGTAQEQQRAIQTAIAVMGSDAADIATGLIDTNPTAAFMMAFGVSTDLRGVEAMTIGNNIRESGAAPKPEDFRKSLKAQAVDIPYSALGDLNTAANDAIFTYALGIATGSEITSGQFGKETLTAARNAVIGEPVQISPFANPTLTYRGADNVWIPKRTVTAQFRQITYMPEKAVEMYGTPTTREMDGSLQPVNWPDVMQFATPIMIRNGVYRLSLPKGTFLGTAGEVLNADGDPMEIDLLNTPVPDQSEINALRFMSTGRAAGEGPY